MNKSELIANLASPVSYTHLKVAGTYSDYCGWYVVLRQNKLDHKTAIEKMKLIHSGQS